MKLLCNLRFRFTSLYLGLASICSFGDALAGQSVTTAGKVVSVSGAIYIIPGGKTNVPAKPLKPQDEIHEKDVINSLADGKAKILMTDKTIIDLGPSGLFKVSEFKGNPANPADRQIDLDLMYGKVRAAVSQKIGKGSRFQIRTPAAVMGVRGTEFVVKSDVSGINTSQKFMGSAAGNPTGRGGDINLGDFKKGAKTEVTVVQGLVDMARLPALSASGAPVASSASTAAPVSLKAGTQLVASASSPQLSKPVQLNSTEVSKVASESKVADNTFQKAITIEVSKSGSDSSSRSDNSPGQGGQGGTSGPAGHSGSAGPSAASGAKAPMILANALPAPNAEDRGPASAGDSSGAPKRPAMDFVMPAGVATGPGNMPPPPNFLPPGGIGLRNLKITVVQ